MLRAIISGTTAGHLVAASLRGDAPGKEAAAAYHHWLAGWFAADAAKLAGFYRELGVEGFGTALHRRSDRRPPATGQELGANTVSRRG